MAGSSRGALGAVASRNLVRQNGSLTMVKKAPPSSRNHHINNNNTGTAVRGSIVSAWQDSRTNLLEKPDRHSPDQQQARQMSAYRRWLARKKVGQKDGAGEERRFNPRYGPKYRETPGAAAILYMGIGMIVVGLVFTFVGLGDEVFHTLELQLIGPSLIAAGFLVCGMRVLVCACAGKCGYCDRPITPDDRGRQSSVDASDDSWRPASWSPKERRLSAASAAAQRPPTPARIALERDDSTASSSTFQDASDPGDLLSLRSEDSSDFSLSEFQEIEIRAPLPEPDAGSQDARVAEKDASSKSQVAGSIGQEVGLKGQDVSLKGQDVSLKGQDVGLRKQDVDLKGQDVSFQGQDVGFKGQDVRFKGQDVGFKRQEVDRKGQEVDRIGLEGRETEEVHSSGLRQGAAGRLENKLSDGLILNVNALSEAPPGKSEEGGAGSDHAWIMAMDAELK